MPPPRRPSRIRVFTEAKYSRTDLRQGRFGESAAARRASLGQHRLRLTFPRLFDTVGLRLIVSSADTRRETAMQIRRMVLVLPRIVVAGVFGVMFPLMIGSCGKKVADIQSDPSFTATSLRAGGVATLGCTSIAAPDVDEMKISGQFSDPLSRALRKHHPNTKVVMWGSVRKTLGEDSMLRYLASVRESRLLQPSQLDSLNAAIGQYAQYLIIQRIEGDELEFDKDEIRETVDGREVHTKDGLETIRRMTVYFGMYDLDRGELVWSATVQRQASKYSTVRAGTEIDIDGLLGLVIDVAEALDEQTDPDRFAKFPKPASQIEVMTLVYGEFAEHLPRE